MGASGSGRRRRKRRWRTAERLNVSNHYQLFVTSLPFNSSEAAKKKKKKASDLLPWRRQSYQLLGSKCQLTAVYWGRASGVRSRAASQRSYWGGSGRPCSENPTLLNSKYWGEKKKIYLYKNLFWSFHFQSFFFHSCCNEASCKGVKVIFHWGPRQHYGCTLLSIVKTI